MVQWLRLRTSSAGGTGSIPGRGPKSLHAARCSHKSINKNKLFLLVMCFCGSKGQLSPLASFDSVSGWDRKEGCLTEYLLPKVVPVRSGDRMRFFLFSTASCRSANVYLIPTV